MLFREGRVSAWDIEFEDKITGIGVAANYVYSFIDM
jgi:hypothetical protein